MKRLLGKYRKPFRKGERGFTLIELLIVVAVLGALAAVVVPSVAAFLGTANLAAANTEVGNVKTAAMSHLADTGDFPPDSTELHSTTGTVNTTIDYISNPPEEVYDFDLNSGQITAATLTGKWGTAGFTWVTADQSWTR